MRRAVIVVVVDLVVDEKKKKKKESIDFLHCQHKLQFQTLLLESSIELYQWRQGR